MYFRCYENNNKKNTKVIQLICFVYVCFRQRLFRIMNHDIGTESLAQEYYLHLTDMISC